ncbi:MAG: hypothetical protein O2897_05105 [bacterium]|nr:hypothetical protein [bacterium]
MKKILTYGFSLLLLTSTFSEKAFSLPVINDAEDASFYKNYSMVMMAMSLGVFFTSFYIDTDIPCHDNDEEINPTEYNYLKHIKENKHKIHILSAATAFASGLIYYVANKSLRAHSLQIKQD